MQGESGLAKSFMSKCMIDLSGWPSEIRLVLLLVPFILIITGGTLNAYIAGSRHFFVMCHAFRRSSGLHDEVVVWGTTRQHARMVIVSAMTLGLIWPSFGYRKGWLSVDDSNEFPGYLARMMKLSSGCLLMGFAMLIVLVSFVKVTR